MSDNDMAIANTDSLYSPIPPYTDPHTGDAIIRTSDGVNLYVLRAHLVALGLDPNGMLSSRQAAGQRLKPEITVQEPAAVWEKLIRVCLMHEEQPYTLDDVAALLQMGRTYGLAGMPSRMRYALAQPAFLGEEPVRVCLVASAFGLRDIARIAARRTLALPTLRHGAFDALHAVTGADYHRLLAYREACGRAASAVATPRQGGDSEALPAWIAGTPAHWKPLAVTCVGACAAQAKTVRVVEGGELGATTIYVRVREAWITYLETLGMMLAEQPRASLASAPELLEPVIASAVECTHCARKIYPNCVVFARAMEAEIERAVSEVKLGA